MLNVLARLSLLGEQGDDEAGVKAAGQQHPYRDVGDRCAAGRRPQRLRARRPPSRPRTSVVPAAGSAAAQ